MGGWGSITDRGKSVQTGSGAHSASCPKDIEGFFLGDKTAEGEADHSPPSMAEAKNGWAKHPLSHTQLCLIN
jgi:hypothetical protein